MNPVKMSPVAASVVLLLVPGELKKGYALLQLLHTGKRTGGGFAVSGITTDGLRQHFTALPEAAKAPLLCFGQKALAKKLSDLRLAAQRQAVADAGTLLQEGMLRHLHQQMQALKLFLPRLKCYHRTTQDGGRSFQTGACAFSAERPNLSFSVVREENLFYVQAAIDVKKTVSPAASFTRSAFLLQKEQTYFLLSYKDFQTLEWLQQMPRLEQATFIDQVLGRLESDYPVDRNGQLDQKVVEAVPLCRVLLSELNNAFLLLTPQWLYDGILVEGPFAERQAVTVGSERVVIARHREAEQQFLDLLSSLHSNFPGQRNGYYYLSFADAQKKQWFLKTYYRLQEQDVEITGMDLLKHFRYSPHRPQTDIQRKEEQGSYLLLAVTVRFGKEAVSLTALQKALHAGQRALVLKDGSLGVLGDDWLEAYALLVKHGRVQGGDLLVSKFLALGTPEALPGAAAWQPPVVQGWGDLWRQWQRSAAPVIALPSAVQATLRPYQQKGFEWLVLLAQRGAGACLADDMGLGKTLQTICFLAWYSGQHPEAQHLIVCPTSLLYNWQRELQKFAPSLAAVVYHGAGRQEADLQAPVLITSYGTLRSSGEALLCRPFGVAVLDESHNIKNPAAQITRAVLQVQAPVRIALSGTPVVNNTFDLYAQLSFVLPGLLGSREFFKREYADAIDRYGDESKVQALQRLTAPFLLRRTKESVAPELPAKTESVLWCTMGEAQEALYQEVREQVRSHLLTDIKQNGIGKAKLAVLQGLMKLRQICNDPRLLPAAEHGGRLGSAKTRVLLEELQQVAGRHRVLVFSQFSSMLQLLEAECLQRGMATFLLDGQTPAPKRMQMVADFQEGGAAPSVFLISLRAGNTGLTLTAADYVFLFDPWWNTAVEQQAVDRTHRIGQTKSVFSYKLVCRGTVEEKILALQQRKKQLAEELITAEEDFVKNLSEEEVAELFG